MHIIDIHTHIYPDRVAERATQATCAFYGLTTDHVATVSQLLESGRAAGIDRFLILPVATRSEGVRRINEHTAAEVASHAQLIGFGTIHPDMQDPLAELDYIRAAGLKGLKLHPDMQACRSDDERLYPVYERLCEMEMPLMIHAGDKTHDFSHPRHLRRALDRFPTMKVIAAHLGGWSHWDEAAEYLAPTGCYVDTSSSLMFLSPEQAVTYMRTFGADRVLFGTDFPMWDPTAEVNTLLSLPLSDDEKERIAHGNAERLLGL